MKFFYLLFFIAAISLSAGVYLDKTAEQQTYNFCQSLWVGASLKHLEQKAAEDGFLIKRQAGSRLRVNKPASLDFWRIYSCELKMSESKVVKMSFIQD